MKQNHRREVGFTLIEMLCVLAIIGILAALLLGAVSKAWASSRNKMWRFQGAGFYDYVQEHLAKYYLAHTNYPVMSAEDLYKKGVFDDRIMDFLRCPHVQYIPFAMSDRADKVIFQIDNDWLQNEKRAPDHTNYLVLTKKSVTTSN